MTEQAGFSICVPSVRATTVEHTIQSIQRQTATVWEVIVVAQGDDEDLRRRLEAASAQDPRVRFVWLPQKGVSRARNAGARAATHDTIVFTDDDCEAAPDWLEQIGAALDADPTVGVVAGSLVAPPRPKWCVTTCPSASPRDFTLRADPDRKSVV
jgi:glycosyltransferase involved in cell wall biosynthesis